MSRYLEAVADTGVTGTWMAKRVEGALVVVRVSATESGTRSGNTWGRAGRVHVRLPGTDAGPQPSNTGGCSLLPLQPSEPVKREIRMTRWREWNKVH